MYRHSCGIHGKEEWGEKPYCTPEDLIERDLGNDEEQLNFNCPEKEKLDLLDVKKYSSVILELRLERLEPNYTSTREPVSTNTLNPPGVSPHSANVYGYAHSTFQQEVG